MFNPQPEPPLSTLDSQKQENFTCPILKLSQQRRKSMKKQICFTSNIALTLVGLLFFASASMGGDVIVAPQNPANQNYQKATPQLLQKPNPQLHPLQVVPPTKITSNISFLIPNTGYLPDLYLGVFCSPWSKPDICTNENSAYSSQVNIYIPQKNFTKGKLIFAGLTTDFDCRNTPTGTDCTKSINNVILATGSGDGNRTCDMNPGPSGRTVRLQKTIPWKLYISDSTGKPFYDNGNFSFNINFRCAMPK